MGRLFPDAGCKCLAGEPIHYVRVSTLLVKAHM